MKKIAHAIAGYHNNIGEYPAQRNSDIFLALTGKNKKKLSFLAWKKRRLNEAGEMLDMWGSPFRITINSGGNIMIHSAGPNLLFGDDDDEFLINQLPVR